jgi:hypothetical protein
VNRSTLRTELQASGFGTDSASVTRQNNWLDAAYTWIWNARDPSGVKINWSFAKVDQANLTVTANDSTPTMPADVGTVDWIIDATGQQLDELDPEEFDRQFAGIVQTGAPYAYKVVNRVVTLGPTPSAAATFTWSYTRRVSHFSSDGVTIVSGTLANDSDIPIWPADHHMILVFHAALVGHALNSNPFAGTMQGLRDDALQAMRADLEYEFATGQQWGDGGWSSY